MTHTKRFDRNLLRKETSFVYYTFQSEVPNGRCDLGSLNSVVAVFSGGVTFVLHFGNLQFL